MKLTYWIAECRNDHSAYNLRAKTRRELRELLDSGRVEARDFAEPRKVEVEYADGFDLAVACLSEGGGWWE